MGGFLDVVEDDGGEDVVGLFGFGDGVYGDVVLALVEVAEVLELLLEDVGELLDFGF